MAKAKQKSKPTAKATPSQNWDGVFMLKMVFYLILGSMWVKLNRGGSLHIPLPVGFAAGLVFAMHEHFQIDRKLEYSMLLLAMLVGYVAPFGLYINF